MARNRFSAWVTRRARSRILAAPGKALSPRRRVLLLLGHMTFPVGLSSIGCCLDAVFGGPLGTAVFGKQPGGLVVHFGCALMGCRSAFMCRTSSLPVLRGHRDAHHSL